MLISCEECNHQISDKAYQCPQCGYPMKSFPKSSTRGKSRKRKRLPNGFGQITKIKSNLRNPYRAMVTVSKTKEGRPICKLLKPQSYFETYNDAYAALLEYNRNPYDLSENITCRELYERWLVEYEKTVKQSAYVNTTNAWAYCSELYDEPFTNIRVRHVKGVIENGLRLQTNNTAPPSVKQEIKKLWNMLFDYAIENEITDKNYARVFSIKKPQSAEHSHISFTNEEMKTLWKYKDDMYVSIVLIHCYTGWRPKELCELKLENINLKEWTMQGGMKTKAGEKRIVVVTPAIRNLVKTWYDKAVNINSPTLFYHLTQDGKVEPFTYRRYVYRFLQVLKSLNINSNHRPHDCRKQFITMAKKVNMDEYAIKRFVGHTIRDITESVYTDRDLEWLKSEMMKLEELNFTV